MRRNAGFTLIELLVVIAIIAVLAVVVVLILNPSGLLQESRDANRLSDMATLNSAISISLADNTSESLGSGNVVYVSVPDTIATSTAGDQCQGLGMPSLPSTYSWHCAASSTFRKADGTGWIPVNFAQNNFGSSIAQLPVDPINVTSSGLYYSYATNGSQWMLMAYPESQRQKQNLQQNPQAPGYPGVMAQGTNLALVPAPVANISYERAITINHAFVSSTLVNFPVLVAGTYSWLAASTTGGYVQNPNGYDIVFTTDAGCSSRLNWEIESYASSSGAAVYWVQVPSVSNSADTVIYVCYGDNSIVTDQSNKIGTWDANYQMVLHMQEPSNPYRDSTSNSYSSDSGTNPARVAGLFGFAQSFTGASSQYIGFSQTHSPNPTGTITEEIWIKTTEVAVKGVAGKWASDGSGDANQSFQMYYDASGKVNTSLNATNGVDVSGGPHATAINDGSWHHVAVSSPSTGNYSLYIDGIGNSFSNANTLLKTTTDRLLVGATSINAGAYYSTSVQEEYRISNINRSADWIKTEYKNQSSPSTFYAVGSQITR